MRFGVSIALLAIAINAVLIQTVATEDSPLKNVVRAGTILLAIGLIAAGRVLIPLPVFFAVLLSFVLLVLQSNLDQLSLMYVLLLAPALWSIPERSLDKSALIASVVGFGLIFALLLLGVTQNTVQDFRDRATFGVASVPFFMNVVYGVSALWIYYAFKYHLRTRWLAVVVSVLGAYYFYDQTDGRGGFFALLVFIALGVILKLLVRVPGLDLLLSTLPLLFLGFFFFLATKANDPWWNAIFSYRPRIFAEYLASLDPASFLVSTSVKSNTAVTNVDQSYIHLLIGTGLFLFVFFCFIWAKAMRRLVAERRHLDLAFVVSAAVYAVSESILLRIENIFIVMTWLILLRASFGPQMMGADDARTRNATQFDQMSASRVAP